MLCKGGQGTFFFSKWRFNCRGYCCLQSPLPSHLKCSDCGATRVKDAIKRQGGRSCRGAGRVASATEFNKHFATRKSQVAHCRDNNKNNATLMNAQQLSQVAFFLLSPSLSLFSSSSLLFLFAFCIVIAISKADEEGREASYGPKWQIKCYQEADTWHIVARITQS